MLAERENEEIQYFRSRRTIRLEEAARQQGMQDLLLLQLEQRFGSVPDATRRRVQAVDATEELTRLAGRILTAESLEDLGLAD